MKTPLIYMLLGAFVIVVLEGALFFVPPVRELVFGPHSFIECAARFGIIAKSYPQQCVTPTGRSFIDEDGARADFVLFTDLSQPVGSSLVIEFGARKTPDLAMGFVFLADQNGLELASSTIDLQEDAGALVRQQVTLTLPPQRPGSLGLITIIKSGGPLHIPITFK